MPIIDYHCHLIPEMVLNDHRLKTVSQSFGSAVTITSGVLCVPMAWMSATALVLIPPTGRSLRNGQRQCLIHSVTLLYHWTHLELKTAFGIEKQLSPKTAREIFDECNEKLQLPEYSARGLMRRYHVECVCTTDDPIDDLRYHKQTRESGFEIKMIPAWRPDKAMNIEKPDFAEYMNKLGEVAGVTRHHLPGYGRCSSEAS